MNRFVYYAREIGFTHPLGDSTIRPGYVVPDLGCFGAGKGPTGTEQHHPAVDMHVGDHDTLVTVYAPHDGLAHTYRDAPKYRHYLSITRDVLDSDSIVVGRLVTILGHIDLDLDEGDSLFMDGVYVEQGNIVSRHLWSGTTGGPHLHWEVRYYRPEDAATESFYGMSPPWGDESFTAQSEGPWGYGFWNPDVGYGFGRAENHGVSFE